MNGSKSSIRYLTYRISVGFEIVKAVAMYTLRPHSVGKREPAGLGFTQTEKEHYVETGIPMFRQAVAQSFRFLSHCLVNLLFRETLGCIGVDAGYGIAHTEIVKVSVGVIELLAYLSQRIKLVSGTFHISERVAHGLFVVGCWKKLPFFRAAFGGSPFPLVGKGLLFRYCVYLLFSLFPPLCEDGITSLAIGGFSNHQKKVFFGYQCNVVGYSASA